MIDNKRFHGDRVRELIEDAHLTVIELSKAAGVSQSALSNWIGGVRNPKRANIKAIANALHCKVSDISDYADTEPLTLQNFDFTVQKDYTSFFEQIYEVLKNKVELYGQSKIAEQLGVSQSFVGDVYNKNVLISNLKLQSFLKLCPNVKITFSQEENADPIETIQAITECLNVDEAEKLLAVLKIVFPEYIK